MKYKHTLLDITIIHIYIYVCIYDAPKYVTISKIIQASRRVPACLPALQLAQSWDQQILAMSVRKNMGKGWKNMWNAAHPEILENEMETYGDP